MSWTLFWQILILTVVVLVIGGVVLEMLIKALRGFVDDDKQ